MTSWKKASSVRRVDVDQRDEDVESVWKEIHVLRQSQRRTVGVPRLFRGPRFGDEATRRNLAETSGSLEDAIFRIGIVGGVARILLRLFVEAPFENFHDDVVTAVVR